MSLKSRIAKAATATAVAGATLVTLAGPASANPNAPTIGYGNVTSGAAVWCVQHNFNYFINNWTNHAFPNIAEDSQWGPETNAAIVWFQKYKELQPDGLVGPQTGERVLILGDPYYTGNDTYYPQNSYCWKYIPSTD
ncbi:peptidoglycan-binding protein [Kitasatospora sp. NPDC053057]|uniref:peptidoglycan-binding protein n=1 Tax=Kitasatospora sp. NPDC053057 TaxID=3364062 RepID=UPI0037C5A86D